MGLGEHPAHRHVPTAQGRGHWGGERPTPLWEPGGRCPHPVPTLSFRRSTATPLIRVFPPALGPRGPSTFLPNCTMCRYVWGRRQLWARPRPPRGSGRAVGAPCRLTHTDPRRLVACVVKPLAADEQTGLATGSGRQREGVRKGRRPCGGGGRGGRGRCCGAAGGPGLAALCPGSAEPVSSPHATAQGDAAVRGSAVRTRPPQCAASWLSAGRHRAAATRGHCRLPPPAPRAHPRWSWPSE